MGHTRLHDVLRHPGGVGRHLVGGDGGGGHCGVSRQQPRDQGGCGHAVIHVRTVLSISSLFSKRNQATYQV
jgi:hypothetical protein